VRGVPRPAPPVRQLSRHIGPIGFRGRPLQLPLRIEPLKHQSAVITKQLMHPHRTQEDDGIIKIPLNPIALTPRASHQNHSSSDTKLMVDCQRWAVICSGQHYEVTPQSSAFALVSDPHACFGPANGPNTVNSRANQGGGGAAQ